MADGYSRIPGYVIARLAIEKSPRGADLASGASRRARQSRDDAA